MIVRLESPLGSSPIPGEPTVRFLVHNLFIHAYVIAETQLKPCLGIIPAHEMAQSKSPKDSSNGVLWGGSGLTRSDCPRRAVRLLADPQGSAGSVLDVS